jgi:hypothetical protein
VDASSGRRSFGSRCVPVVVAAPHLRRYVLFGNLFAAAGNAVYRIDDAKRVLFQPGWKSVFERGKWMESIRTDYGAAGVIRA